MDRNHRVNPNKLQASTQLIGRVLLAAIFLLSGLGKINAPEATQAYIAKAGMPMPVVVYFAAVVIEIVGGIALIGGFKTRWTAGAFALYTLIAAVFFHSNFSDRNQLIHFMKNIAMIGGFLQVMATGAGALSWDERKNDIDLL